MYIIHKLRFAISPLSGLAPLLWVLSVFCLVRVKQRLLPVITKHRTAQNPHSNFYYMFDSRLHKATLVCVCVCVRAVWSSHNSVPALFDVWFLGVLCAFPLLAPFQRIIRAKPGVIFWHSAVQRAQTRRTQMETLKCEAICWVAIRSYRAHVTTLHTHSQQNRYCLCGSSAAEKINTFAIRRSWDELLLWDCDDERCGGAVYSPVVTICTTRFNIHKFCLLPTQCIYVFCVDLRTNSDYFSLYSI